MTEPSAPIQGHYLYGTTENLNVRDPFDHYRTDPRLALKAIDFVWMDAIEGWVDNLDFSKSISAPINILDTGVGTGVWGHAMREYNAKIGARIHLEGVELNEQYFDKSGDEWTYQGNQYDKVHKGDYLTWESDKKFDLIIGNPPYAKAKGKGTEDLATPFSLKSLSLLTEGGILVYLLRLNFVTGKGRYSQLFEKHPLLRMYICSRRPSFRGKGTNGHDYALFVWKKGHGVPHEFITKQFLLD